MQIGASQQHWKQTAAGLACTLALFVAPATAHAAPLARGDAATSDSAGDGRDDTGAADVAGAAAAAAAAANATPNNAGNKSAAAPGSAGKPAAPADRAQPPADLGRVVREVTKPLLEELAHSDVAEAVRAIDTKADATLDAGLEKADEDGHRENAPRRRAWDGSEKATAPAAVPGQERDPQADKLRTSVLLSGLIEDVKPWAFGALALYILGSMAKFGLAVRRRSVQRRAERRRNQRRRSSRNSGHSSGHSQNTRL